MKKSVIVSNDTTAPQQYIDGLRKYCLAMMNLIEKQKIIVDAMDQIKSCLNDKSYAEFRDLKYDADRLLKICHDAREGLGEKNIAYGKWCDKQKSK